eukprot:9660320-Karenia_brevis.AAC.1
MAAATSRAADGQKNQNCCRQNTPGHCGLSIATHNRSAESTFLLCLSALYALRPFLRVPSSAL